MTSQEQVTPLPEICTGASKTIIVRMLPTVIYNVLKKNEPYKPELYRKGDGLLRTGRFLWKKPSLSSGGKVIR